MYVMSNVCTLGKFSTSSLLLPYGNLQDFEISCSFYGMWDTRAYDNRLSRLQADTAIWEYDNRTTLHCLVKDVEAIRLFAYGLTRGKGEQRHAARAPFAR